MLFECVCDGCPDLGGDDVMRVFKMVDTGKSCLSDCTNGGYHFGIGSGILHFHQTGGTFLMKKGPRYFNYFIMKQHHRKGCVFTSSN